MLYVLEKFFYAFFLISLVFAISFEKGIGLSIRNESLNYYFVKGVYAYDTYFILVSKFAY